MMSVMREITEYVLNSPIALTSALDCLLQTRVLLTRQRSHSDFINQHLTMLVHAHGRK